MGVEEAVGGESQTLQQASAFSLTPPPHPPVSSQPRKTHVTTSEKDSSPTEQTNLFELELTFRNGFLKIPEQQNAIILGIIARSKRTHLDTHSENLTAPMHPGVCSETGSGHFQEISCTGPE